MNRALYAAASGMAAQQTNLDIIANNLANADVAGFKGAEASFASIGGTALLGTAQTGVHPVFAAGKLMKSGGPFDLAIDGAGFFLVERDGRRALTRAGSFTRSADGHVRSAEGWRLNGVEIPKDAVAITVAADGKIVADLPDRAKREIGQIRLVTVDAPERLRPIGSALFAPTPGSGAPRNLLAGGDRQPKIAFGMLERSNVSIIEAMMQILTAQRAYEANAKGVQAADEMLRIANNLHRS